MKKPKTGNGSNPFARSNFFHSITLCTLAVLLVFSAVVSTITVLDWYEDGRFRFKPPEHRHCKTAWVTNGDYVIATGWDRANKTHARWTRYTGTNTSTDTRFQISLMWERLDPDPIR